MNDQDIQIFEQLLDNGKGTLSILCGGLGVSNPKAYMDSVVSNYVKGAMYNEFIEVFLDNPYVRVIITGINEVDFNKYDKNIHALDNIKSRLKSTNDGNAC